jgi:hypothetical protein
MTPKIRISIVVAASLACLPASAVAQMRSGTPSIGAEIGARTFPSEPVSRELGKFLEYRDVPSGLLFERLSIGWVPADSFRYFNATVRHAGQADQQATLRLSEPGAWDVQVKWDRVPHLFSTTARSFGSFSAPDVMTLPTPRPDTTAWATAAPSIAPVRTAWDAVKAVAAYTASPRWDIKAEITDIGKKGYRPLGMAFGSPGNNFREVQEPIDQRQRDLRLSQSYQTDDWQMVAMYSYASFDNAYNSVTSDNPLVTTDSRTAGSSRGRSALAPSNSAHTGVITVAGSLPWRTRVSASGMYSLWKQDAPFIPSTINSQITDVRLDSMPKDLEGRAGTAQWYLSATSRPLDALTLTAKLREFRYRDDTELERIPVRIVNDRSVSAGDEREALTYNRKFAELAGSWRLERSTGWPITLGSGLAWDHWVRGPHRNVYRTSDVAPRVSMDADLGEYASLRVSWGKGWRRTSDPYIQNTTSDAPTHRRFDQANRDRERTNFMVSAYPISAVMLSAAWSVGTDEYPDSPFGTQFDRAVSYSFDGSWSPVDRLSVWSGYTRETFATRFRSRYRTTGQLENPTYDWVANNVDAVNTLSAGFRASLVPDRWEVGGQWDRSASVYQMRTFNPLTPAGGTASQNFAATASDLPAIDYSFEPFSLFVTYQYSEAWATTLRYQGEIYDQKDFRTLGLLPYEGGGVFLANDYLKYNVRYLTVTFSYRPRLLKIGRSAL